VTLWPVAIWHAETMTTFASDPDLRSCSTPLSA